MIGIACRSRAGRVQAITRGANAAMRSGRIEPGMQVLTKPFVIDSWSVTWVADDGKPFRGPLAPRQS
ncbi:hypothetical protein [Frateuria sp. GZRR35]|uniref:hypothetical protein n=1 Tax=Frateuria sp. GZRR35 TaxID=3351536 RepID=UPI003F73D59D